MRHEWQALERNHRTMQQRMGCVSSLLLIILALIGYARIALFFLRLPELLISAPVPGLEQIAQAQTALALPSTPPPPIVTPTPAPAPSITLAPTAMHLAIEQSVYDPYAAYFEGLMQRTEMMALDVLPARAVVELSLESGKAQAAIYWASEAPAEAILLREEPYVIVTHHLVDRAPWTLTDWAKYAQEPEGGAQLVTCDVGQAAQELLGIMTPLTNTIELDNWLAIREYVATHPESWAVLPWDAVNVRVRVQPANGIRLDPRNPGGYPLMRRLWLVGGQDLELNVVQDLQHALEYAFPASLELVAVGDIMLGRGVKDAIGRDGPYYPFDGAGIQPLLSQADIAFGNLESVISEQGVPQDKTYTFRADPQAVLGLVYAGLDVLSLANNHIGDYGKTALVDTLDLLEAARIAPIGAGRNITEAFEAKIVTANGIRVAFLAYNTVPPESFAAGAATPGSATLDSERLIEQVREARIQADVVVVSCHWGNEYSETPSAAQRALAEKLVEAGATLIIGHHPHVLQSVAFGQEAFIAYSLGNFVFDMTISAHVFEGVALRCIIDTLGIKTVELLPYVIVDSRPNLDEGERGRAILQRLWRITQEQEGLPQLHPRG